MNQATGGENTGVFRSLVSALRRVNYVAPVVFDVVRPQTTWPTTSDIRPGKSGAVSAAIA